MIQYMTPHAARLATEQAIRDNKIKRKVFISESIRESADAGNYSAYFRNLTQEEIESLIAQGFWHKAENDGHRIHWGEFPGVKLDQR